MGDAARLFGEHHPGSGAFRRHRAVRAARLSGHQRRETWENGRFCNFRRRSGVAHRPVHRVPRTSAIKRDRSEEKTSELQSLMSISYAVFCFKKKITSNSDTNTTSIR